MALNFHEGEFIYINKPYRMSSFGALAHIRFVVSKRLGIKRVKIGHAGTLDPLATGVLVLCTGRKTKLIDSLMGHTKEYRASVQFGATTASFDKEHPVDATYPKDHITRDMLQEALPQFIGDIEQVPPVFSACNVNGKRAYEIGRKGNDVELAAKNVHIDEIEILEYDDETKHAVLRVVCGRGTYIRSLARDLGKALDSGAYLTDLCRTRSGEVRIEDCMDFDQFDEWFSQQEVLPYLSLENIPNPYRKKGKKNHGIRKSRKPKETKQTPATETLTEKEENNIIA